MLPLTQARILCGSLVGYEELKPHFIKISFKGQVGSHVQSHVIIKNIIYHNWSDVAGAMTFLQGTFF